MISFTVLGQPQPQGSTRAFVPKGWTRPIITTANKNLKPWRQAVSSEALRIMREFGEAIIEGQPVKVEADFFFDKPKSTHKSVIHKITKPDTDKLLRSLFDSLSGTIFKDDSQVVRCTVSKNFGSPARAEIRISKI